MRTPIMSCCRLMAVALFLFCSMPLFAQRQDILLNDNWKFRFSHQVQKGSEIRVDLPHTWNTQDALSGKIDYKRGIGNYEKKLFIRPEWQGKRLFLRFEGANSIADVFINRRHIGEHRGGYGAFVFEITGEVNYGKENSILVRVNNGEQLDVMPLVGDFNFYGGIYRDVHLLITDEACISPLNYASPGVRLIQDSVSHQYAKIRAVVDLANGNNAGQEVELGIRLLDGQKVVAQQKQTLTLAGNAALQQELTFEINNPHLWNGRQDPFLYQAEVSLSRGGQLVDCVTQPLGLRYYRIDPDKGFFLNGKHLPLHGVCRHQDRSEVGNALRPQHHEEDAALMLEMGVNAVRLAHYPQATYSLYGICLISVRLTVRKAIVRELMIRGWLPLTGKYVKTRSTFIRLTGTRKNLCFIWPENVTPYVPDVCKRLLHSLISPGRNCLSMEKAMVRQCRISMLF